MLVYVPFFNFSQSPPPLPLRNYPSEHHLQRRNMLPLIRMSSKHHLHGFIVKKGEKRCSELHFGLHFSDGVSSNSGLDVKPSREVEKGVLEKLQKQISLLKEQRGVRNLNSKTAEKSLDSTAKWDLDEAYARCGQVSAEFSTFHWGAMIMPPERRRAIWAINAWARRVDDLVDGHTGPLISKKGIHEWVNRLVDLYQGRPHDASDAALADTVSKYSIDIQLFKDMIEGMSWDLEKLRYENFDELYLYSYHIAGTVGLMILPVIGIAPESEISIENVFRSAIALGIASQLTNILRDVGEDARRGRIYLPQDELARAGLSDDDIFKGKVTEKWRNFTRAQIGRAKIFFDEAEKGIAGLDSSCRWPVWAALLLYRDILGSIEANAYNNFTQRAFVKRIRKPVILSVAYAKALMPPRPWSSK